jgi:hypothetical protein
MKATPLFAHEAAVASVAQWQARIPEISFCSLCMGSNRTEGEHIS